MKSSDIVIASPYRAKQSLLSSLYLGAPQLAVGSKHTITMPALYER
jgi:hypothetical protein